MIRVRQSPATKRNMRMLNQELRPRILSAQGSILKEIASMVRTELISRIPGGNLALRAYRNGFKVALIDGVTGGKAFAIMSAVAPRYGNPTVANSLVYFPRQASLLRQDVAAAVLSSFEPWAIDMLPPVDIFGPVKYRRVTPREVQRTRADNAARRPMAMYLLRQMRVPMRKDRAHIHGAGTFDLENFVMRMELGLEGAPHHPHWAKALALATSAQTIKRMGQQREVKKNLNRTLFDPTYTGWKRPDRATVTVKARELEPARAFMTKIRKR